MVQGFKQEKWDALCKTNRFYISRSGKILQSKCVTVRRKKHDTHLYSVPRIVYIIQCIHTTHYTQTTNFYWQYIVRTREPSAILTYIYSPPPSPKLYIFFPPPSSLNIFFQFSPFSACLLVFILNLPCSLISLSLSSPINILINIINIKYHIDILDLFFISSFISFSYGSDVQLETGNSFA